MRTRRSHWRSGCSCWSTRWSGTATEPCCSSPNRRRTPSPPSASSPRAATGEVTRAAVMIQRATGRDTHPYFRFPYGSRNGRTLRLVHSLGYASVRWTVDTWGWMGLTQQSVGGAVRRVLANLVPGEIVLMHLGSSRDHSTIDSNALPAVIRLVRARGYRFVTLAGIRAPR